MPQSPNFLIFITDHTNADALRPRSQCRTPNLDALAERGARIEGMYTVNAICSPSRATLMTGMYPSTHGVWDCTHTQRREWVDVRGCPFWSERLAAAGYTCGHFGKWHVEQSGKLDQYGFLEYDPDGSAKLKARARRLEITKPGYRDYLMAGVDDEPSATHQAVDKGIDFVRRHGGDGPFACVISTAEPHDPYVPPASFLDAYDIDSIELSPTAHEDVAAKPEAVRRMAQVWEGLTDADWRLARACYFATVSFLDAEVGRAVDALEDAGVAEDTVVLFLSDHGDMLGAHGLATKGIGTPYEQVYNIPLVACGPGLAAQGSLPHRTSMVDLAPTLCDLAGAQPLAGGQGRSLRPVLDGTADPAEWTSAYAEFYGQRFVYTQRIVWEGPWKYVFSPGGADELYNLDEDPEERHNLAGDAASRERLEAMATAMWRKVKEIGDESLLHSHYATLRTAPVGPLVAD